MTRIATAVVAFTLLPVSACAQAPLASGANLPAAADHHTIQLASDACPAVRPGDRVSLDWNPGFEHPGVVQGLGNFSLRFGRVDSKGVTVHVVRPLLLHQLVSTQHFTSIGNGYFHIELTVPFGAAPGQYRVLDANAMALTVPDYQGPALWMTNSPVAARYCITVVPLPPMPSVTPAASAP